MQGQKPESSSFGTLRKAGEPSIAKIQQNFMRVKGTLMQSSKWERLEKNIYINILVSVPLRPAGTSPQWEASFIRTHLREYLWYLSAPTLSQNNSSTA
jgi:hypothetical protein